MKLRSKGTNSLNSNDENIGKKSIVLLIILFVSFILPLITTNKHNYNTASFGLCLPSILTVIVLVLINFEHKIFLNHTINLFRLNKSALSGLLTMQIISTLYNTIKKPEFSIFYGLTLHILLTTALALYEATGIKQKK